jgi:hypothetical protein
MHSAYPNDCQQAKEHRMTTAPHPVNSDTPGPSPLARWGIAVSLAALPLPVLVIAAFIIGATLRRRGETGAGQGVMALGAGCALLGILLLVILVGLA